MQTEFRVFDGTVEVTADARITVMRAGQPDAPAVNARTPLTALAPAVYDVEARHMGDGGIVKIRRTERLTIVHYPDESGRHVEVINFDPGFGALQVRTSHGQLSTADVALLRAGDRSAPMGRPIAGGGYVLFVVPAGRYDVRVQHGSAVDARWLTGVDVPAGATRLTVLDSR